MNHRFLSIVLLVLLVACGPSTPAPQPQPVNYSLSGSVIAPTGGDVAQTIIKACREGACGSGPFVSVVQSGSSGSFLLENLEAVSYTLVATKDVNGNGKEDIGDYRTDPLGPFTPTMQNITIQLEEIEDTTPPGPPVDPNNASISGTLVAPGTLNDGALKKVSKQQNDLHANKTELIPGEVIVTFKPGFRAQAERLQVSGVSLARVRSLATGSQLYRTPNLNDLQTRQLAQDLRSRSDVASAHPNWIFYSTKTPDDTLYPLQWHYGAMNLPAAWDIEDGLEPKVTVAVVDSGVIGHPDLLLKTLPGYDFISSAAEGGDGDGRDNDPKDEGGDSGFHGAHVAGTVLASSNDGAGVAGVSWGAELLPVRVLGVNGSGSFADILDGTAWAGGLSVEGVPDNPNKARVINMSLGGDLDAPCDVTLFRQLADAGVIVVVAAGNENEDTGIKFPGSCDGVVTVGATGPLGTRAPYSNFGPDIDVMAPGGDTSLSFVVDNQEHPAGVLSTIQDENGNFVYAFYQGTSMASPHIAGLVALMLAKEPTLTFDAVVARLKAASKPLSAEACNRPNGADCGAGFVDAAAALGSDAAPPPPPPPPTENVLTYVIAFYCLDANCDNADEARTRSIALEELLQFTDYSLRGLAGGLYLVGAWQDLNDNLKIDAGEPLGAYESLVSLTPAQQAGGVVIRLKPFEPAGLNSPASRMQRLMQR